MLGLYLLIKKMEVIFNEMHFISLYYSVVYYNKFGGKYGISKF